MTAARRSEAAVRRLSAISGRGARSASRPRRWRSRPMGRASPRSRARPPASYRSRGAKTALCSCSPAYLGIAGDSGKRRSRRADRSRDRARPRLAPADAGWVHDVEGPDDMPAHVKTMLTGVSLHVPVIDGMLALGTWQGIYRRRAPRPAAPARDRAAIHRQSAVIAGGSKSQPPAGTRHDANPAPTSVSGLGK